MKKRIMIIIALSLAMLLVASCEQKPKYVDYSIPEVFRGEWTAPRMWKYRITEKTVYKQWNGGEWTPIIMEGTVTIFRVTDHGDFLNMYIAGEPGSMSISYHRDVDKVMYDGSFIYQF